MKNERHEVSFCPKCCRTFTDYPALSRVDNKTLICPDCGVREALENAGIAVETQEEIITLIHKNSKDNMK